MIEPVVFQSDNVIGVRVDGKVGEADFDAVVTLVEDKLQRHEKLRIYVEIPAYEGMSPAAFFADLKLGVKHWNRFERQAVVTDEIWIQHVSQGAAKLFTGMQIRVFPMSDQVLARQWIEQ